MRAVAWVGALAFGVWALDRWARNYVTGAFSEGIKDKDPPQMRPYSANTYPADTIAADSAETWDQDDGMAMAVSAGGGVTYMDRTEPLVD